MLGTRYLYHLSVLLSCLPFSFSAPVPRPEPLPSTLAQSIIAGLTLLQAGIIGYAIHHGYEEESLRYIGKQLALPWNVWPSIFRI